MAGDTITKRQLCERVAEQVGCTQKTAKEVVQRFMDEIIRETSRGNRMEFRKFGVFEPQLRGPRKARNPRTGEKVDVPEKVVVSFKAGKEMEEKAREALNVLKEESSGEDEKPGG